MTPRLKILSVMLALSIVYSVYDYIERNKKDERVVKTTRKAKKRPGTARVSKTRGIDLQKKMDSQKINKQTKILLHSLIFFLYLMKLFLLRDGPETHLWKFLNLSPFLRQRKLK